MKLLSLFSVPALALTLAVAGSSGAKAFTDSEKKEIGAIVRDYLLENPEIMIEVQEKLVEKREADRQAKAGEAVSQNKDAIFSSTHDIALGNPDGKVTVVEFFDYNCTYCKSAISDMDAIIKANPEVRFVLKEFPILGEDSVAAHKVSDAFRKIAPEKYGEFHRQLLGGKTHANEAVAMAVAVSLGVSEDQIRAKMAESSSDDSVRETYMLAQNLGITGTPSYVVGNEAIFGAVGSKTILEKVANVDACGKATC